MLKTRVLANLSIKIHCISTVQKWTAQNNCSLKQKLGNASVGNFMPTLQCQYRTLMALPLTSIKLLEPLTVKTYLINYLQQVINQISFNCYRHPILMNH